MCKSNLLKMSSAVGAVLLLMAAVQVQALTIDSAVIGSGRGCADITCFDQRLTVSASAAGSGSLTLGVGSLTLDVTLPLTSYVPLSGTNDNGVTQLDLSNVVYSGTASVSSGGVGVLNISGGTASIAGDQTPFGAGTAGSFAFSSVSFSGTCNETGGGSLLCGLTFATITDANFDVNGATRYFQQTMNLTAVPEPGTALLIGLGLAGLAVRRR